LSHLQQIYEISVPHKLKFAIRWYETDCSAAIEVM